MRQSEINLSITLDEENIPKRLQWNATDRQGLEKEDTKAFTLSIWDTESNSIMKIDLWTDDMLVGEMKRFYIQQMGAMSETILTATGDEEMAQIVNETAEKMATLLMKQEREGKL
jgi:gliding motility-associated protein GldC